MNHAIKAALLSGLVLPGLGQMFLKQYRRGIALMLAALAGLSVIAVSAVQKTLAVLDQVRTESGDFDMEKLSSITAQAAPASDSLLLNAALGVLVFCWAFGIIDAYRIGKEKDSGTSV